MILTSLIKTPISVTNSKDSVSPSYTLLGPFFFFSYIDLGLLFTLESPYLPLKASIATVSESSSKGS